MEQHREEINLKYNAYSSVAGCSNKNLINNYCYWDKKVHKMIPPIKKTFLRCHWESFNFKSTAFNHMACTSLLKHLGVLNNLNTFKQSERQSLLTGC